MLWLDHPIFIAFVACVLIQSIAWFRQKQTNNADTVDIAWTLGIVVCALLYVTLISANTYNIIMVTLFPIMWYLRLLIHLVIRYDVMHEDSRYQNLRAHWNQNTQIKFFVFFQFQAVLSVLFSLTAYWVLMSPAVNAMQIVIATVLGLFALICVGISDNQLYQFKKANPNTKVCDVGFWAYSRHPNYFFEWLHWFVYPILLWHTDYFWWSLLIVALMLLFLLKLTGIPFSEQQAIKKRGQAYLDYMNKTSAFIPWINKS